MGSAAAVRSWRAVFSRLRESVSSLEDLFSQSKLLVSASPHLPPEEVVEDMLYLVNVVSSESSLIPECMYSKSAWCKACCLIVDINSCMRLNSVPNFVPSILQFLEKFIELCLYRPMDSCLQQDMNDIEIEKCVLESLQALGQIALDYEDQMSPIDMARVIAFLINLINCPAFSFSRLSRSESGGGLKNRNFGIQRLVFVTLGNLLTRPGISLSSNMWHEVVKTLRDFLEAVTTVGQLIEDIRFSRFYAAMLHCVQVVLTNVKGSIAEHVGGLVTTLHRFFAYGLGSDHPAIYAKSTVNETSVEAIKELVPTKAVYRPPHLRRASSKYLPQNMQNDYGASHISEHESGMKIFSSDSEQSDSDGSVGDGDRFRSSKTRVSALLCIQALGRSDAKSLHAYWVLLFPTHDVLNFRRLQPTLLHIALMDPVLKVRMTAASTISLMLEQPSRAFMQVAEYKESGKFGSFMTLSCSLGQILVQLQRGLAFLVQNEKNIGLLVASLKALSLFVAAAPFHRLPGEILPNIISALQKGMKELFPFSADQTTAMCMALGCLGCALNTALSSQQVARMLSDEISGIRSDCKLLHDLVIYAEPRMPSLVRVEALQALKCAVHNYPSVMVQYWVPISSIIKNAIQNLPGHGFTDASSTSFTVSAEVTQIISDGKADSAAAKLLDEFLRAVSGSLRVTEGTQDDTTLNSFSPALSTACLNNSSFVNSFPVGCLVEHEKRNETAGISHWNESLENYLPFLIKHSAALVRGAAINCFAGLTYTVFYSLPDKKQNFIIDTVWQAVVQDENPSVRSAACRAIGVLITFPGLVTRKNVLSCTLDRILQSASDTSVMVRITASWALANLCDVLRSASESETLCFIRGLSLTALAECAIKLSKDGDKVRANAVRALGNVARFVSFGEKNPFNGRLLTNGPEDVDPRTWNQGTHETFSWLERMVQTLVSCVTTGNVKVQWNVCHAFGNLFLNKSIALSEMPWVESVFSILLLLLRDSANFKIRIQAASALAVPESRGDFGDSFYGAIQALVLALDSLDSKQVSSPSSFKYMNALNEQLTATFLHVMGLIEPQDFERLQEFLSKHGPFLEAWIKSIHCSVVLGVVDGCQSILEAHGGTFDDHFYRSLMQSDKPELPPKARTWYSLNDGGDNICKEERISKKKTDIKKVTEVLMKMYNYGNQTNTALLFEQVLAHFSS